MVACIPRAYGGHESHHRPKGMQMNTSKLTRIAIAVLAAGVIAPVAPAAANLYAPFADAPPAAHQGEAANQQNGPETVVLRRDGDRSTKFVAEASPRRPLRPAGRAMASTGAMPRSVRRGCAHWWPGTPRPHDASKRTRSAIAVLAAAVIAPVAPAAANQYRAVRRPPAARSPERGGQPAERPGGRGPAAGRRSLHEVRRRGEPRGNQARPAGRAMPSTGAMPRSALARACLR